LLRELHHDGVYFLNDVLVKACVFEQSLNFDSFLWRVWNLAARNNQADSSNQKLNAPLMPPVRYKGIELFCY